MKQLGRWVSLLASLLIAYFGFFGWTQPEVAGWIGFQPVVRPALAAELPNVPGERLCKDTGQKIDLNNANLTAFTDCPGFYPTLARLIVTHGPYQKVKDVLKIAELTDGQKDLLKVNLDNFTVTDPVVSLEERMPPRPAMRK